jgi:hypothetical protein
LKTSRLVVCAVLATLAITCPNPELRFAAGCAVLGELLEVVWSLPR